MGAFRGFLAGSGRKNIRRFFVFFGAFLLFSLAVLAKKGNGPLFSFDSPRQMGFGLSGGAAFLDKIFNFFSFLGEPIAVFSLFAALLIIFYFFGKRKVILPFLAGILITSFFIWIFKLMVARPRPNGSVLPGGSFSFPSGHSALSLMFYGFASYVFSFLAKRRISKIAVLSLGAFIVLAVGFSRLYLGAHYLSDVAGGYMLGASILFLSFYLLGGFRQAVGKIEK